jgi:sec-independent protein translocase protein TatC
VVAIPPETKKKAEDFGLDGIYPEESQRLDVIGHLEELRRRILISLGALTVTSMALLAFGQKLMHLVKAPLAGLDAKLIFISPTEAFTSYLKVAIFSGFVLCFPVILYQAWAFFATAVSKAMRRRVVIWLLFALVLFAAGLLFSYFIALPAALNFLIRFGSEIATPAITLGKYVSFFIALLLIGGVIFEIPIVIGLLTDLGWLKARLLKEKRPLAVVVIFIIAAVVTPTTDAVNLILFALPMILLYEIGIILSVLIEKRKQSC